MATHTNQLYKETSPYLLQHAQNPVHWFAWGEEALAVAKAEQKPILVSIGYAACHWCHVMEKESFENEQTAGIMNDLFINIKIDREERPDLDHIYMDAVQAISGSGGWPLNVFLTPDGKPFYGGTYFPPKPAHGRNSWTEILYSIADSWKNRRDEIETQANQLINHIENAHQFIKEKQAIQLTEIPLEFTAQTAAIIADNILKNADNKYGGFGKAPKFPQTFSIRFLIQHAHFAQDKKALQHAELSLHAMINGGIYDQIRGGMARYSTDDQWLAPHFEKMLYDNALLIIALSDAYAITKNPAYSNTIQQTIAFLEAEMKSEEGGYFAALDADSEGHEGKFYVWEKAEIENLLGDTTAIYCAYYNVSTLGNWEGTNILHITKSLTEIAKEFSIELAEAEKQIKEANTILLTKRNQRIRPQTDDKIILGWNALLLTAFCKAYATTGENEYKILAKNLYSFLKEKFLQAKGQICMHTYKHGLAKIPAFLDDYAWYIEACIQYQEITGEIEALFLAKKLTEHLEKDFSDKNDVYFYYTYKGQPDIVARKIEVYDGATPSANGVMTGNLTYLGVVFDKINWQSRAQKMLLGLAETIIKYPNSFAVWASIYEQQARGINELILTGSNFSDFHKEILQEFIPGKVFISSNVDNNLLPLLAEKDFIQKGLLYLCWHNQCFSPVSSLTEYYKNLKILLNKEIIHNN